MYPFLTLISQVYEDFPLYMAPFRLPFTRSGV